MTDNDAERFIDQHIRPRFPAWTPPDADVDEWITRLKRYDYDRATHQLQQWWFGQTRRPRLPAPGVLFYAISKARIRIASEKDTNIHDLYFLRIDGRMRVGPYVCTGAIPPRQQIEEEAQVHCTRTAGHHDLPVTIEYCERDDDDGA